MNRKNNNQTQLEFNGANCEENDNDGNKKEEKNRNI